MSGSCTNVMFSACIVQSDWPFQDSCLYVTSGEVIEIQKELNVAKCPRYFVCCLILHIALSGLLFLCQF